MVRRAETIELHSTDYDELMEEFKNDVEEKRNAGWMLYQYSFFSEVNEYCVRYVMERGFPYNQNAV